MDMIYIEEGYTGNMVTHTPNAKANIMIKPGKNGNKHITISEYTGQIYDTLVTEFKDSKSGIAKIIIKNQDPVTKKTRYQKIKVQAVNPNSPDVFDCEYFMILDAPINEMKSKSLTEIAGMIADYEKYKAMREEIRKNAEKIYLEKIKPNEQYIISGYVIRRTLDRMGYELADISDNTIKDKFNMDRKTAQRALDVLKDNQEYHDQLSLLA